MRDYLKIKAFQHADDLALRVYGLTRKFPREELYGLTAQLRRAVVSAPANIAEGASRQHRRDYLHFLYIARGSMVEAGYLLYLATRLGYATPKEFEEIDRLREEAAKTLFGLMSSVEKELSGVPTSLATVAWAVVVLGHVASAIWVPAVCSL